LLVAWAPELSPEQMLKRRDFLNVVPRLSPREKGYWLHVNATAMACRFEATISAAETGGVRAAQDAFQIAAKIERHLTVFNDESEVSYVNRNAAYRAVAVTKSLWDLLVECRTLHRETEGTFDVTSSPLSRCWGFLRRNGRVPSHNEIETSLELVGIEKLRFDENQRSIAFDRVGVEINFGSIGKGYALDRMGELMRRRTSSTLLSAGSSSLLAVGSGGFFRNGWLVGIRDPAAFDRRLAALTLRDCAMSTSGSEEQFFEHEGKRYGHIIDPRTGHPSQGIDSATVIAKSAALTDALATAFYVGGVELAERYCDSHSGVMAVLKPTGAQRPLVIGNTDRCDVEILN